MSLRTRIAPALLLLALTAVGLLPAAAAASWPGANGPVVYVGLDPAPEPLTSIVRYRATGLRSFVPGVPASVTQLTTDPTDRDPKVSADGRRIVFTRTIRSEPGERVTGIFVANVDGTGLTQVTAGGPGGAGDVDPAFFPSGNRIAFVRAGGPSDRDGRGRLLSIRLDGGGLRTIASGYAEVRTPAVSPNGRQIAFQCRHFRRGLEYSWEHICSVRPDGSHRRDLTPGFKDGQPATDPDFSPLGRVIAFSVGPGTAADVFTVRGDGARLAALTNRGPRGGRKFPRARGYDDPSFAPAGGALIAVARSGSKPRFVLIQPSLPAKPQQLEASILGRSLAWAPAPR